MASLFVGDFKQKKSISLAGRKQATPDSAARRRERLERERLRLAQAAVLRIQAVWRVYRFRASLKASVRSQWAPDLSFRSLVVLLFFFSPSADLAALSSYLALILSPQSTPPPIISLWLSNRDFDWQFKRLFKLCVSLLPLHTDDAEFTVLALNLLAIASEIDSYPALKTTSLYNNPSTYIFSTGIFQSLRALFLQSDTPSNSTFPLVTRILSNLLKLSDSYPEFISQFFTLKNNPALVTFIPKISDTNRFCTEIGNIAVNLNLNDTETVLINLKSLISAKDFILSQESVLAELQLWNQYHLLSSKQKKDAGIDDDDNDDDESSRISLLFKDSLNDEFLSRLILLLDTRLGVSQRYIATLLATYIKLFPSKYEYLINFIAFKAKDTVGINMHSILQNLYTSLNISPTQLETGLSSLDVEDWGALIFIVEVYSRLLLVITDSEFLAGNDTPDRTQVVDKDRLVTLTQTVLNITFWMYWNTPALITLQKEKISKGSVFKLQDVNGLFTRFLNQVYVRDSRCNFCPPGHWLLTSKLGSLDEFISAVMSESEEEQNQQDSSDQDYNNSNDDDELMDNYESDDGTTRVLRKYGDRRTSGKNNEVGKRMMVLRKIPFCIPFDVRVLVFRELVKRDKIKNNLQDGFNAPKIHATIKRESLFEDAFNSLNVSGTKLKQRVQITFVNNQGLVEAGIDGGGVFKEFITMILQEIFSPDLNLFQKNAIGVYFPTPIIPFSKIPLEMLYTSISPPSPTLRIPATLTKQYKTMVNLVKSLVTDDDEDVEYKVVRLRDVKAQILKSLEFVGKILGKAIYEGILVDVEFAEFFLEKLLGRGSYFDDLKSLDAEVYESLIKLKSFSGDFNSLELYFSIDEHESGQIIPIDLIPHGAQTILTAARLQEYILRMSHHKLTTMQSAAVNAFSYGLFSVIPQNFLKMFSCGELQYLVSGVPRIDVDDWRENTLYAGWERFEDGDGDVEMNVPGGFLDILGGASRRSAEQERRNRIIEQGGEGGTVDMFWKVVKEMSIEEQRMLLKFATSCRRPPLLGFKELNPKFCLRCAATEDETRLPTASTCVNLLKLPKYKDEKTLR
ncbi:hypothetical protein HK098_006574, partial [Nowakowskiella sp. JEL0407]